MLPWDNRVRLTWFCVCVCVLELICACIPDLHLDSDLNMSSTCISSCVGDRNLVKRYFEEKKRNHIASRYNTSLFRCYKTTGWVLTKLHDENRGELEQQEEREWCRTALAQEDMGRLLTSEGFFLQSVIYPFTLCCISVALQWKSPFSPQTHHHVSALFSTPYNNSNGKQTRPSHGWKIEQSTIRFHRPQNLIFPE